MDDRLQKHILSTYLTLRYGIVLIGALLPVVVYLVGVFNNVPLQNSISAYYWASVQGHPAPSRDWFVGSLFAVAAFLYLYKGFSKLENLALNVAAMFAVGVAVSPMEWQCEPPCVDHYSVHGFCAVAMFACLVYVVWFRSRDTLTLIADEALRARYRRTYAITGLVMLAAPVTAFVLNSFVGTHSTYVFFIEAAGIWAFALYWWVKSAELAHSAATVKALSGEVAAPGPAGGPLTHSPADRIFEMPESVRV